MSLIYLEHEEIIDTINRRRESRQLRNHFGRQALELRSITRMGKDAIRWLREAWVLRDCANGSHPALRVLHRATFDLGNGTEKSIRLLRCDLCGETVHTERIRPVSVRLEINEPDGCTSGTSQLRQ